MTIESPGEESIWKLSPRGDWTAAADDRSNHAQVLVIVTRLEFGILYHMMVSDRARVEGCSEE